MAGKSEIRNPHSEILVLLGPTGSGKTALSIELSRILEIEIISADSRQLYTHLDIGTAKPGREELAAVPHHFIDILSPDQDYNAGIFGKDARRTVDEIIGRSKRPVVVGGSGLYIQALVDGFFEGPSRDPELRERLELEMERIGPEAMYARLREFDPDAAETMDATKKRRVIRALEVYHLTGKPISQLQKEGDPIPYPVRFIGLRWERDVLYRHINRRVDLMLENGLLAEAEGLLKMGYSPELNALQTVGYKEAFQYLAGTITHERMVELIKMNTRRYAKRQMTWFRADQRIEWIPMEESTDLTEIARRIASMVKPLT